MFLTLASGVLLTTVLPLLPSLFDAVIVDAAAEPVVVDVDPRGGVCVGVEVVVGDADAAEGVGGGGGEVTGGGGFSAITVV